MQCFPGPLRASSEELGAVEITPLRACVSVAQSSLIICDPWAVARQAPLPVEFSRQEYWCGLPFPSPGGLPGLRIEAGSPILWAEFLFNDLRPLDTEYHVMHMQLFA